MTLTELSNKLTYDQLRNLRVVGGQVVYDDGTNIYTVLMPSDGQVIPTTLATKTVLTTLATRPDAPR